MDTRFRYGILTACALGVLAAAPPLPAQSADSLPPGVTMAMVQKGKALFTGAGLCLACHGVDGKGTIGPSLVDGEWLHGDGSFEWMVRQVLAGVDMKESKTGQPMPPRGGSGLKDEDVRAVSAYVWALSRG
jgi:mono/diheme cytochrome c family protein